MFACEAARKEEGPQPACWSVPCVTSYRSVWGQRPPRLSGSSSALAPERVRVGAEQPGLGLTSSGFSPLQRLAVLLSPVEVTADGKSSGRGGLG